MDTYLPILENYYLEKNGRACGFKEFLEINFCPYFLHTLIPYIVTLSEGGIFHWMSKEDPDAVKLMCPNPNGGVVCTLKRKKEKNGQVLLEAEIVSVGGSCIFGHTPGSKTTFLAYEHAKEKYDIFNIAFPWLVFGVAGEEKFSVALETAQEGWCFRLSSYGRQSGFDTEWKACSKDVAAQTELKSCKHICRYHKWPRRKSYGPGELTLGGLCPDFFHSVYPHVLSSLYKDGLNVSQTSVESEYVCPCAEIGVKMVMRRTPLKSARLRSACLRFLNRIGKSLDWPFYEVSMEIMGKSAPCPRGHKEGQKFLVNLGPDMSMCPAAFDAYYPFWHAMARGAVLKDSIAKFFGGVCVRCPDIVSQNVYGAV